MMRQTRRVNNRGQRVADAPRSVLYFSCDLGHLGVGAVAGRRIRLTHSGKREARLEKMSEFFDSQGISSRTIQQLKDAAEELLTNAFYDAPVAAGAFRRAVPRTQEIALPDDSACDLAYGC